MYATMINTMKPHEICIYIIEYANRIHDLKNVLRISRWIYVDDMHVLQANSEKMSPPSLFPS